MPKLFGNDTWKKVIPIVIGRKSDNYSWVVKKNFLQPDCVCERYRLMKGNIHEFPFLDIYK